MNKQEALVALLARCRKYEEKDGEVARVAHEQVLTELLDEVRALDLVEGMPPSARRTAKLRLLLEQIGSKALYLLVDEVEVVAGRSLDEWLVDQGPQYVSNASGISIVHGPASPAAINGAMVREVYAKGVQDGRRGA